MAPPPIDGGMLDAGLDGGIDEWPSLEPDFVSRFGSTGPDVLVRVGLDAAGNVYVAGKFSGTIDFGGGPLTAVGGTDVVVASFTAAGAHRWSRAISGSGADEAGRLAVSSSGTVYVTGRFGGVVSFMGTEVISSGTLDGFAASFDAAGTPRWFRALGGNGGDDFAQGVGIDPTSGNVWVTGRVDGVVNLGSGSVTTSAVDLFLARLDAANGTTLYANVFVNDANQSANDLGVDAAGNVYLVGQAQGTVTLGAMAVSIAPDHDYDVLFASFAPSGTTRFVYAGGSALGYTEAGNGLAVDATGVTIAGSFGGTMNLGGAALVASGVDDAFVARYTLAGMHVWSHAFGGSLAPGAYEEAIGIAAVPGGGVCAVGAFGDTLVHGARALVSVGQVDIFVTCFDDLGAPTWATSYGSVLSDGALAIAAASDGSLFVSAIFQAAIDFGATRFTPVGGYDAVLFSLTPPE